MHINIAETRSVSIPAPPATVHAYLADAHNLPDWAPAFAAAVRPSGPHWTITQGSAEFDVALLVEPQSGTVDIVAAADRSRGAFLRVLPNGDGSELLFTLFFAPDAEAKTIDDQMRTVVAELAAARRACAGVRAGAAAQPPA